jgi:6-phospho-3-hexuloisomerase
MRKSKEAGDTAQSLADQVLAEISMVLQTIDEASVQRFIKAILAANRIVTYGAGRMGILSSTFAMRLMHLGFQSHVLREPTTPAIGQGDLLILSSGSGETQTVYDVAVLAKNQGVQIALMTVRPVSRLRQLADVVVEFSALQNSADDDAEFRSIQPMTTLTEQSLLLFLDIVVLKLMKVTQQTTEDLWRRHCNLE